MASADCLPSGDLMLVCSLFHKKKLHYKQNIYLTINYSHYLYCSIARPAVLHQHLSAAVVDPGPGPVQHRDGQRRVQLVHSTDHRVLRPTEPSHQSVEGTFTTMKRQRL